MTKEHFDGVESIRVRLMDRLTGPFTRLMIRPMPEVALLEQGICSAIIRGHRINQIVPIMGGSRSCYYTEKKPSGWKPECFRDSLWASGYVGKIQDVCSALAIPVGHVKLDTLDKLQFWVEGYTPWSTEAVAAWFRERDKGAWLSVMRVYKIDPVNFGGADSLGLGKVAPFIARGIRPVIDDESWSQTLNELDAMVSGKDEKKRGKDIDPKARRDNLITRDSSVPEGYGIADFRRWEKLLKRKRNLVFHGVPGTGKTYVGRAFARWVVGGDERRLETVQFHPGFAYEDFIQGLRPVSVKGQVRYELTDGLFLRYCKMAAGDRENPYVFFIDELNRASLPRVFGELNFLLEYRDESISLSGGGISFSIPPNMYIVATMNEADRSVSSIDQAMIRRFSFVHLKPNYFALEAHFATYGLDSAPLVALLKEINEAVSAEDVQMGISFFMQDGERLPELLADIWIGEVEPYLKESFYGHAESFQLYTWEAIRERLDTIKRP